MTSSEGGDLIAVSEAKKKANAKWDAANMTILGCKVTKTKAEAFRQACKAAGTNPNAVLLATVNKFLEEHADKE